MKIRVNIIGDDTEDARKAERLLSDAFSDSGVAPRRNDIISLHGIIYTVGQVRHNVSVSAIDAITTHVSVTKVV